MRVKSDSESNKWFLLTSSEICQVVQAPNNLPNCTDTPVKTCISKARLFFLIYKIEFSRLDQYVRGLRYRLEDFTYTNNYRVEFCDPNKINNCTSGLV